MRSSLIVLALFAVIAAVMCSCARPKVAIPGGLVQTSSLKWIDLQPGWRVRVVTPILRSGGYLVKAQPVPAGKQSGTRLNVESSRNTTFNITLAAGPDFIGYEVSSYAVKRRRGGGVRVIFKSAEIHEKQEKHFSHHPIAPLFQLPQQAKWVRILHLIRVSQADHDAAILAADRRDLLDALTQQVQSDPSNCKIASRTFCSWIPLGIAVIPESQRRVKGKRRWTPMM